MTTTNNTTSTGADTQQQRLVDEWHANYDQLYDHVFQNGSYPDQHATNPAEAKLGAWLQTQIDQHNTGLLHPDAVAKMDELPPVCGKIEVH